VFRFVLDELPDIKRQRFYLELTHTSTEDQ